MSQQAGKMKEIIKCSNCSQIHLRFQNRKRNNNYFNFQNTGTQIFRLPNSFSDF